MIDLSDFSKAAAHIKSLEGNWENETEETERRRRIRYQNISVSAMRNSGLIKRDATYIPRRIADANIRREIAPYIAYLTQSRDVAKFKANVDIPVSTEPVEQEFTFFATYDRWQLPFFQTIDGALTHGWDAIETVFDETKPGHFCNRHIGHENLLFAFDVTDIQHSPAIAIAYGITLTELADYVDEFGFNAKEAETLMDHLEAQGNKSATKLKIWKFMFKDEDGTVNVGWFSHLASDWLKKPHPLFMGVMDEQVRSVPRLETEYPVEILQYSISENEVITESKGRVFYDEHDDEACTQLVTSFVNRAIRSSYILTSPVNETDDSSAKQTEVEIGDGKVFHQPVTFYNIAPPDASLLGAMNTIITQNLSEVGQVNFAAMNRRDSRKTAEEIKSANQQAAMLNSVQVTLLSAFMRNVWKRCWATVRSQVLSEQVKSAAPNWQMLYSLDYSLLPSGDVEVVRRQELLQQYMNDWPVMQGTPAAKIFLKDFIRLRYPQRYSEYSSEIDKGDRKDNLIKGLGKALQTIVANPESAKDPGVQQGLLELKNEFASVMTNGEQPSEPAGPAEPQ